MATAYSRNPTVEVAPMRNEMVLFNARNGKFCLLNATAAHLWGRLDTPQTVDELVASVEASFAEVDADAASRDIETALSQLLQADCVVKN